MKIESFYSENEKYLNTLHINYLLTQMENRILIKMTNDEIHIAKNTIKELFENLNNQVVFLEDCRKDNKMQIHINLKNIEFISKNNDGSIFVKFINGHELILEDIYGDFVERFNKMNIEKLIH